MPEPVLWITRPSFVKVAPINPPNVKADKINIIAVLLFTFILVSFSEVTAYHCKKDLYNLFFCEIIAST
jgi:hypothetical protein